MAEQQRSTLNTGGSVRLDATGSGRLELGPDSSRGPAHWRVDGVILQTNRPGKAPIPRAQVYLDEAQPTNSQGLTYDGSFAQGRCDLVLGRGQKLVCVWTGGLSGDTASMTITGEKW
jgi:hypothetical protein